MLGKKRICKYLNFAWLIIFGIAVCFNLLLAQGSVDLSPDLAEAARSGDIAEVRRLLESGADVNARKKDGTTALHLASHYDHREIVKLLLNEGANINAKKTDGTTVLHLASEYGHTQIVKLLLDEGANINAKKTDGTTALHLASEYNHTEIVKLLIDDDAKIDASLDDNRTPLFLAVEKGRTEIVKLLIDAGADVNIERITMRKRAAIEGLYRTSGYGYSIDVPVYLGTPLLLSVTSGDVDIVKLLLDAGAKTDAKVKIRGESYTSLDIAEHNGDTEIVKLLKEYGAEE